RGLGAVARGGVGVQVDHVAPSLGPRGARACEATHAAYRCPALRRPGTMGRMQFGRSYEEFEVGAVYKHWPGKTVTEYDDHLFCLLTMNHHPLHLDANYAENTTQFKRNVVVG